MNANRLHSTSYPKIHGMIVILECLTAQIHSAEEWNRPDVRPSWLPSEWHVAELEVTSFHPTVNTVLVRLRLRAQEDERLGQERIDQPFSSTH